MSTFNGVNATGVAALPAQEAPVLDQGAKLRVVYDSFTPAAALAAGDIVNVGAPLPAGAKIHKALMNFAALGAGDLELGWAASSGGDSATPAGFIPATACTSAGQATMEGQSTAQAGQFYKALGQLQVQVKCTVSTSAPGLIQAAVYYSLD